MSATFILTRWRGFWYRANVKIFVWLVALAFTFGHGALANIGESRSQVVARLGNPMRGNATVGVYERGGFRIVITFDKNGVSVTENVLKLRPTKSRPVGASVFLGSDNDQDVVVQQPEDDLTDAEILALLKAYGANIPWNESEGSYEEKWMRSDGKVLAMHLRQQSDKGLLTGASSYALTRSLLFGDVQFVRESQRKQDERDAELENRKTAQESAGVENVFGAGATPTPIPTPTPAAFSQNVKYSQQAAAQKFPELSKAGSSLNKLFVARMKQWQAAHDPRMDKSDWPERLAEDCVAHP